MKWECPSFHFTTTGKVMPGFDGLGNKDAACWNGNDINDEGKKRWQAAKQAGRFQLNPYTKNPGNPCPFAGP